MRLISATVRNYRLHRELTLGFDRARTLIGGSNEAGKSTLIEAIHRGLFFPAKSAAEPQKRMRSNVHSGHPEVELAFEAGAHVYQLRKRFNGPTGSTTLTQADGKTWHGAEAEEQLGRLLGVTADSARAATECWAHLWVWQGVSGDNPEAHVTTQRDAVLARLQSSGGAAAMQSELDGKVAAHFEQLLQETLTQGGKPKAGSELEAATSEAEAAQLAHNEALERVARLRQAASDIERTVQAIADAERDLVSLTAEQARVTAQRERATILQHQLEREERVSREAKARVDALGKAHARIGELERDLASLREKLVPLDRELAVHAAARHERSRLAGEAESTAKNMAEQVRRVHLRRDLAEAWSLLMEKRTEQEEATQRLAQGRVVETELSTQRESLAQLPEIDAGHLRKLQQMESDLATAQATLAAMAAGLEVIASDLPVVAGGQPVAEGQIHIVTEDTEVSVGPGTRLRIRPGGGQSLGEARAAVRTMHQRLQNALDGYGLPSVAAATESAARRAALAGLIKAGQTRLADFNLTALVTRMNALGETLAGAEGRIARLRTEIPDAPVPADLSAARAAATVLSQELANAETADRRARARAEAARHALAEAETAYEQQRQLCDAQRRLVTVTDAQLRMLVETHGDASARASAIGQARSECEAASAALAATQQSLAALQPELLSGAATRLQRAVEEKRRLIQESDTRKAVAQAHLSSDGSCDPQADLAQADARRRFAGERLAAARRRIAAIQLLHELFRAEQRQLADQFTRPLADRISSYLRCVFGAGARAAVTLLDNTISGLELVRGQDGQGAIPFESLSGGTREQVAAAVRLATAELLAINHDGCLPVVFDDAFAYSDPERVRILQGMLDLAAERGLQLIVLTCNPADYAGLGAREVSIVKPATSDLPAALPHEEHAPAEPVAAATAPAHADTQQQLLRTVL